MWDGNEPFRISVDNEFSGSKHKYGVYIVRILDSKQIIYIGKAGSICNDGNFKRQDLQSRLKNTRGSQDSQTWFRNLVQSFGALRITYIVCNDRTLSPAFVETLLLQAFLNDFECLPAKNKSL